MSIRLALLTIVAMTLGIFATPSFADDTVRIGLIGPFSGDVAIQGVSWKQAVDTYIKEHGEPIPGKKVKLITRDVGGVNPAKARALAQELVVKEKVQYIIGIVFTPNAVAIANIADRAHVPFIVFNAMTSSVLDASKYIVRTSSSIAQVYVPAAIYALQHGYSDVVTMVSDYAPGADAEKYFSETYKKNGGKIVGQIRIPLSTTDFMPYVRRAKLLGAQTIVGFMPGGTPIHGFVTAYTNSGLRSQGVRFLGMDASFENDLPQYGDLAEGTHTFWWWSAEHDSPENKELKNRLHKHHPGLIVNFNHVEAWDGMHIVYKMIQATGGEPDGDKAMAAVKGLKWISPRGPVEIDPNTRDLLQNMYLRVTTKGPDGKLYNKEVEEFSMVPDYGRSGHPLPTVDSLKSVTLR
jgi:branched-chain amino acid transport system substrate-binding protein